PPAHRPRRDRRRRGGSGAPAADRRGGGTRRARALDLRGAGGRALARRAAGHPGPLLRRRRPGRRDPRPRSRPAGGPQEGHRDPMSPSERIAGGAPETLVADALFDGDSWHGPTAVTVKDGRIARLEAVTNGPQARLA